MSVDIKTFGVAIIVSWKSASRLALTKIPWRSQYGQPPFVNIRLVTKNEHCTIIDGGPCTECSEIRQFQRHYHRLTIYVNGTGEDSKYPHHSRTCESSFPPFHSVLER